MTTTHAEDDGRARFEALVGGVVAHWDLTLVTRFASAGLEARILRDGDCVATLSHEETAMGRVWRVTTPARTPRLHRGVGAALVSLREALSPGRSTARVLFVTAEGAGT